MSDRLDEIGTLRFGDPQIRNGKLVVPLEVKYEDAYGGTWRSHYLTQEKLGALARGAESAVEDMQGVVNTDD